MFDRLAAIALPSFVFVVLAATRAPLPDRDPHFPAIDASCGAAELVLPPSCAATDREPCESCTLSTCRMDGEWVLELRATGLDPACSFEVRAREKGFWAEDVVHWFRGGRVVPCARDGDDALRCRLALDPVRVVSLALVGRTPEGRLVNSAVTRILVGRDGALDIRDAAVMPTVVIALVALALALLILVLARRAQWPAEGPALDRRRALLTAAGAGASMVLGALLPADVGGFDAHDWVRLVWLVPIGALLGIVVGLAVARARVSYAVRSRSQRVAFAGGAVLAALTFSLVYRLAISENTGLETRVSVKYLFYATIGVALFLPCAVYPVSGVVSGPTRATRLFGATVLGAALLGVVALATGRVWDPSTHQGLLSGFYKPPSAFAITLVQLPFLAALAVAVSVGRERPAWLDALVASLDGALAPGSPDDRMARVRELARGLARRVDDLARLSAPAAAPLSYFAPMLIAPLLREANERAQLALDADELAALERALEVLIGARGVVPYHEASITSARVRVQVIPWSRSQIEPTLVLMRSGALDDDPELRRRLAQVARTLAGAPGLPPLAHGGYVVVDLTAAATIAPGGASEPLHLDDLALPRAEDSRMLAP